MTEYKIFPAIGVARVGNAPEKFYIGPEDYRGLPANPDGSEFTEADFRDQENRLCRQAARFRVFRIDNGVAEEVTLATPGIRQITWTAHLANKKPSWYEFQTSLGENGYAPNHPLRNPGVADRSKLIIDAGPRSITGVSQRGVAFGRASVPPGYQGHFPEGALYPVGKAIDTLGELQTDAEGRMLVLGGFGISGSTIDKNPPRKYANNDDWWDDVSDGPVGARIEFTDGSAAAIAEPAWVLVAPPKFAPQIANIVTLYDTIFDAAVRAGHYPELFANGEWQRGYRPNFRVEIRPLFERASLYPWVAAIPPKPHDFDFDKLGKLGPNGLGHPHFAALRRYVLDALRPPDSENVIVGSSGATMMPYIAGDNCLNPGHAPNKYLRLTDTQYFMLQQWADGWFYDAEPPADRTRDLTRAVLDNCVGGAFSPGIEMTWISRNQPIYTEPFRIRAHFVDKRLDLDFNPARGMEAGDISRYMAVPWQADFNQCSSQPIDGRTVWWWPAQRPEFVYLPPERRLEAAELPPPPDETIGPQVAWIGTDFDQKGADFISFADNLDMVKHWHELGFVIQKVFHGRARFVEVARALQRQVMSDAER